MKSIRVYLLLCILLLACLFVKSEEHLYETSFIVPLSKTINLTNLKDYKINGSLSTDLITTDMFNIDRQIYYIDDHGVAIMTLYPLVWISLVFNISI